MDGAIQSNAEGILQLEKEFLEYVNDRLIWAVDVNDLKPLGVNVTENAKTRSVFTIKATIAPFLKNYVDYQLSETYLRNPENDRHHSNLMLGICREEKALLKFTSSLLKMAVVLIEKDLMIADEVHRSDAVANVKPFPFDTMVNLFHNIAFTMENHLKKLHPGVRSYREILAFLLKKESDEGWSSDEEEQNVLRRFTNPSEQTLMMTSTLIPWKCALSEVQELKQKARIVRYDERVNFIIAVRDKMKMLLRKAIVPLYRIAIAPTENEPSIYELAYTFLFSASIMKNNKELRGNPAAFVIGWYSILIFISSQLSLPPQEYKIQIRAAKYAMIRMPGRYPLTQPWHISGPNTVGGPKKDYTAPMTTTTSNVMEESAATGAREDGDDDSISNEMLDIDDDAADHADDNVRDGAVAPVIDAAFRALMQNLPNEQGGGGAVVVPGAIGGGGLDRADESDDEN
jgi:hypothetical protein